MKRTLKDWFTPARIELCCGWLVLIVACLTYLLTLEPSASYWDCGEYVSVGALMQAGHPPGNPGWMLTARVFANFAPNPQSIALMINAMSGILSALTVLLLYRTIVLLCRMVWGKEHRLRGVLCGVVGALILCWSDTFWYSAVEAEVYAYAAFITALTLWLALKWRPGDYRIPVLLAYLMGLSIGIHLLCLLTIPALMLVLAYRHYPRLKTRWAAVVVLVSFIPVFFILYGLMPGALSLAAQAELLCVNTLGMSFNTGVLIYVSAVLVLCALAVFVQRRVAVRSKVASGVTVGLALFICGITSVGGNIIVGAVIAAIVAVTLIAVRRDSLLYRHANLLIWCSLMLFIGYSVYALMLIRGMQEPPLNQNRIDNIFALQSYIDREQYGKAPLFYGPTPYAQPLTQKLPNGTTRNYRKNGRADYVRNIEGATPAFRRGNLTAADSAANKAIMQSGQKDYYLHNGYLSKVVTTPELNVPLTRMYSTSSTHQESYLSWTGASPEDMDSVEVTTMVDTEGNPLPKNGTKLPRPSLWQQLKYFGGYQVCYMYLRYLLWNFVGRQNDIPSQGQFDSGNFITGIKPLDRQMTGNTDLLPPDITDENPGHNIYYGLPLLLGILGMMLLYRSGSRGRSAFWIVMTLFLLTGVAIVLFLNQTPNEPRERDYSFAGSFYAYAIWCGIGVMGLFKLADRLFRKRQRQRQRQVASLIVSLIALAIPVQMLSQTYDDHDRSNRTAARDFAVNYLQMCEPNALIFTDGDNFIFPWWYVREVEGVRTDVRILNLSYLYSPWYINTLFIDDRDAKAPHMQMRPEDIAYGNLDVVYFGGGGRRDALEVLREVYSRSANQGYPRLMADTLLIAPMHPGADSIAIPARALNNGSSYLFIKHLAMLDMIATNAAEGWPRPVYWTSNSGGNNRLGLQQYLLDMGPIFQLTDVATEPGEERRDLSRLDSLSMAGVMKWGGFSGPNKARYPGPEACDMAAMWRRFLVQSAAHLARDGRYQEAVDLAQGIEHWIPFSEVPYTVYTADGETTAEGIKLAWVYSQAGEALQRPDLVQHGQQLEKANRAYIQRIRDYSNSLPAGRRLFVSTNTLRNLKYQH